MTATAEDVVKEDRPAVARLSAAPAPKSGSAPVFQGSNAAKAATLLVLLGPDISSQVLRQLTHQEVDVVSREVATLQAISSDSAQAVMAEFTLAMTSDTYSLSGGVNYARKLLTDAFGADASIIERIMRSVGAEKADLAILQKTDSRQLAKLIYNEHPQVIALVLSHLIPSQAATLLSALPADMRPEIVQRFAQLDQFSPEMLEKISSFIGRRLKSVGEFSRDSQGGVRAVAEVMNRLPAGERSDLLQAVAAGNKALSESIGSLMFVFDDFLQMDREEMVILLTAIDRRDLPIALKGTSEKMCDHFANCMSQRAGAMFREDVTSLGPVKIRDVEAAQGKIIACFRELQAKGTIGDQSGDDRLIV